MNLSEALTFLAQNQPMPDDPPDDLFKVYREITEYLFNNPDPSCIPFLIGSFGRWDDWTVYDSVQSVLRKFPAKQVVPHLKAGLESDFENVRMWSGDSARYFPHPLLVEPLAQLMQNESAEVRLMASAALEMIEIPEVVRLAREQLPLETDEDVIDVLQQIIAKSSNAPEE